MHTPAFQTFLNQHKLPESYLDQARQHFQAVVKDCLARLQHKRPVVLGINGCQGSGKSTLAAYLETLFTTEHGLNVVNISIDDFYLSKAARAEKAKNIHPLLATRGVPGTHDTQLALQTLQTLLDGKPCKISRFNKACDDLYPEDQWDTAPAKADLIILEGWFLGALPQEEADLLTPINSLEKNQDADGQWRYYVNAQLKADYQILFSKVDSLVMLKAPSFDSVFNWRLEQENKLAKNLQSSMKTAAPGVESTSGIMNTAEIAHFIHFFQRITEHALAEMPGRADHCYYLNSQRQIIHEQHQDSP